MVRAASVPLLLIAGCSLPEPYVPGSLLAEPHATTIRCLDVAVDVDDDPEIESNGVLVTITFANRCDRSVPVNLRALKVIGKRTSAPFPMTVFDPARVIRPGRLDFHATGSEHLEFDSPPTEARPSDVCVDVGAIESDAQAPEPGWLCSHHDKRGWR